MMIKSNRIEWNWIELKWIEGNWFLKYQLTAETEFEKATAVECEATQNVWESSTPRRHQKEPKHKNVEPEIELTLIEINEGVCVTFQSEF